MPLVLALMVTTPDLLPVTFPFDDTVAMPAFDVDHWKFFSSTRPFPSRKTAVNWTVLPLLIVDEEGETVTEG